MSLVKNNECISYIKSACSKKVVFQETKHKVNSRSCRWDSCNQRHWFLTCEQCSTRFTIMSSCGISEKRVLVTSRTFHLQRRGIHATKCVTQCDSDPQIVLSDTFWVLTEVLRLFCILFFFQDLRLFSPEDKMWLPSRPPCRCILSLDAPQSFFQIGMLQLHSGPYFGAP